MRDPSEVIAEMRAQAERSIGAGGLAYELCVLMRAWADRLEAANMPPAISAAMQCVGTLGASLSTPQPASADVVARVSQRLIHGFMLDCNAIGLLGAAENLHKGLKQCAETLTVSNGGPHA